MIKPGRRYPGQGLLYPWSRACPARRMWRAWTTVWLIFALVTLLWGGLL